MVMYMNYGVIFPSILDCGHFKWDGDENVLSDERVVKDYEIDFNITGNRTMILDGKKYLLQPNSIVFRRPGQLIRSTKNFNMYMLTLQLDGRKTPQKNIRHADNLEIQSTINSDFFSTLPVTFVPMHYNEICNDYIKIIKNHSFPDQKKKCEAILEHLLYLLFADAISEKIGKTVIDSTAVEKAITYMEANYKNSDLKLGDIAKSVNMSDSYMIRLFKNETGFTPKDYLNNIRMRQAKWYITYTNDPVYTISYLCGFDNPQYFISKFKAMYGLTPQAFRKKNISENKSQ